MIALPINFEHGTILLSRALARAKCYKRVIMKRTVFYKKKWSKKRPPFVCQLADKPHRPKVKVRVDTPAGFEAIPYKEIDKLIYETREGVGFETLAESTAAKIATRVVEDAMRKGGDQRQKGEIRVTVRVTEGTGFWVEAVEEKKIE